MKFPNRFTTVLVGPNGTGKSNLLEALTVIFLDLDRAAQPRFAYDLEYTFNDSLVSIRARTKAGTSPSINITVDGAKISLNKFSRKRGDGKYLPRVFGYYSGPGGRMEPHFRSHKYQFSDALRKGIEAPLRPFLYAELVHSQLALLSFFCQERQDRSILRKYLRIDDLDSVLFVLKQPPWFTRNRRQQEEGDPRFWGATGVVKNFLGRLFDLSLAPIYSEKSRRWYLFLKSKQDLIELARPYTDQQQFFEALESLYAAELIEDVRANVIVRGVDEAIHHRELSDGELQLLLVLGLLRFFLQKETLILLDEPDTHLNPEWSREYTRLIRRHVKDRSSQLIMATHDPLVIAGLTAREVFIMERDELTGLVTAEHPRESPKGKGVAALLTSEVFGLRSDLDPDTLALLDQKRDLVVKKELTSEEYEELGRLNRLLGRTDLTTTVRDPMYPLFVQAMTLLEEEADLDQQVLSTPELKQRQEIALEVMRVLERLRSNPATH
jgi:ABC-type cobalamin/Fe3+-siderophores transport system ATPase subunit